MPTPKGSGLLPIPLQIANFWQLLINVNKPQRGDNKLCVTFEVCFVGLSRIPYKTYINRHA